MIQSQKALQIWRKAEIHRKACEIGRPTAKQPFELCECCDQIIYKDPIKICEHTKQLQIFGYGYPLWFSFIKHCMLLIFVLIVSKTATQIYIATQQNHEFCYGTRQFVKEKINLITQKTNLNFKAIHLRQNQNQFHENPQRLLLSPGNHDNFKLDHNQFSPQQQNESQQKYSSKQDIFVKQKNCTSFLVYLSFFKQQKMIQNEFLKLIQFFAILISLVYFRNNILKKQQYYKQRICSMSNYTLLIDNLPKVMGIRQSIVKLLKERFRKHFDGKQGEVQDVIFVFQDQELKGLLEKSKSVQKEMLQAESEMDQQKLVKLKVQFEEMQSELKKVTKRVRKQIDNDQITCEKAIVIMLTQKDKKDVLESFHSDQEHKRSYRNYFNLQQQKKENIEWLPRSQIRIQVAHEPNQIIWNNIDHNQKDRKLRVIIGWVVTFIILAIATLIFYFIIKAKTKLVLKSVEEEYQNSKMPKIFKLIAALIVVIALLGILLFNKFILQYLLRFIVKKQKHGYIDKEDFSFATKYAIAIFFTTGLMTLIVEVISYQNFYTHHLGIIEQQSLMFFIVALVIPLILWINPFNMYKNWQREKVFGKLILQQQANQMMQDYPYDLSKRYSQVFKLLWLTFLYAGLIPLGSFLTLLGLFFYYWVQKYNFIHYSAHNPGITGKMATIALKAIDACLFLMYSGQFLFNLILRNQFDTLSLILMIIGIIYLFMPMSNIVWNFNYEQFKLEQRPFDQAQYLFRQTYISSHPVYMYTHKNQIEQHRRKVLRFYEDEIKRENYYLGAGRGMYFKDKASKLSDYSENL